RNLPIWEGVRQQDCFAGATIVTGLKRVKKTTAGTEFEGVRRNRAGSHAGRGQGTSAGKRGRKSRPVTPPRGSAGPFRGRRTPAARCLSRPSSRRRAGSCASLSSGDE